MSSTTISKVIDENDILIIGKHKTRSIHDVIKTDPNYICWMRNQPWAIENEDLMRKTCNVKANNGMRWGKHKGKDLQWILLNDEGYLKWLKKSEYVQNNCPDLKKQLDKLNI